MNCKRLAPSLRWIFYLTFFNLSFSAAGQVRSYCTNPDILTEIRAIERLFLSDAATANTIVDNCCQRDTTTLRCHYGKILQLKKANDINSATAIANRAMINLPPEWQPYFFYQRLNLLLLNGNYPALHQLADSLEQQSPSPFLRAAIAANRGVAYQYQAKYPAATEQILIAKQQYEAIGDSLGVLRMLNNLGNLQAITQGYAAAQQSFMEVATRSQALGMARFQAVATFNVGNLYVVQDDPQAALPHYQTALRLHRRAANWRGMGQAHAALGLAYQKLNQVDSALFHLETALPLRDKAQDLRGKAFTWLYLAKLQRKLEQFDQTEVAALQALKIADSLQLEDLKQDAFELLAATARAANQPALALQYENRQYKIRDSILGARQVRTVVEMTTPEPREAASPATRRWTPLFFVLLFSVLGGVGSIVLKKRPSVPAPVPVVTRPDPTTRKKLNQANRELAAAEMSIAGDTAFFQEIIQHLDNLNADQDNQSLQKLKRSIEHHHQFRTDWKETIRYFREVYPQFFKNLQAKHPSLTNNDLRHAAYLRMGLSAKEVAPIMRVKYTTIEMARYRLKKKIGLSKQESLLTYLLDL